MVPNPSTFKQFLSRSYWDNKKISRHYVNYDKEKKPTIVPKGFLEDDTLFIEIKDYNDFLKHLTIPQRKKLTLRKFIEKVKKYKWDKDDKRIRLIEKSIEDKDTTNSLFELMKDNGLEDEDINLIDWNS